MYANKITTNSNQALNIEQLHKNVNNRLQQQDATMFKRCQSETVMYSSIPSEGPNWFQIHTGSFQPGAHWV